MTFRMPGDRRVVAVLVVLLAAAVTTAIAIFAGTAAGAGRAQPSPGRGNLGRGPGRGHDRETYTIGLFGDMPDGALGRSQYPNLLANVNQSHVAFSIFDGDLQGGAGELHPRRDLRRPSNSLGERHDQPARPEPIRV